MKMRTSCVTRRAHAADLEAGADALAEPHLDSRQMRVHRAHAVCMRDHDQLAPAAVAPCRPGDPPRPGRRNARSRRRDDVDTFVEAVAARAEHTPNLPFERTA